MESQGYKTFFFFKLSVNKSKLIKFYRGLWKYFNIKLKGTQCEQYGETYILTFRNKHYITILSLIYSRN